MHRPHWHGPFEQPKTFAFTEEKFAEAQVHIAKYPEGKQQSAVMPLLWLVMQQEGWVSIASMEVVAAMLDMPYIRVHEVASFYSMYMLNPVGKHHVQVCGTTPCWLRGSDDVMKACTDYLGIKPGHTTDDGLFSLSEVECLGSCVSAPMVEVCGHHNDAWYDYYYEDLNYESTTKILQDLKAGHLPEMGSVQGRKSSEPLAGPTTLENQRELWKKAKGAA